MHKEGVTWNKTSSLVSVLEITLLILCKTEFLRNLSGLGGFKMYYILINVLCNSYSIIM